MRWRTPVISMLVHFPPSLSKFQEKLLRQQINDWCLASGLVVLAEPNGYLAMPAPVTLFPSPLSKTGFEEALKLQTSYNAMYSNIAQDPQWLLSVLEPVAQFDEFTAKLIKIYKEAAPKRTQRLTGGLFRSDYIIAKSQEGRQIKQVEFNTVSVSFGALSTKVSEMHAFLTAKARTSLHGEVPVSPSLYKLSEGLAQMHRAYCWGIHHENELKSRAASRAQSPEDAPKLTIEGREDDITSFEMHDAESEPPEDNNQAVILVIVQPDEINIFDQRLLEFELFSKYNITTFRVTLQEAHDRVSISEDNRLIHLLTGREISVVYYRSGYSPDDYKTEGYWETRAMLERSHAIQCPSVLTQLAGSKKVQQLLCDPQILDRFAPEGFDEQAKERLRKTFVAMYPMDESPLGLEGRKLAFENPSNYVLKPQREGGGNNIYREDIVPFLESIPKESWGAYILMELIEPPRLTNRILRKGEVSSGRVVNELGVFGTVLWDTDTGHSLQNQQAGWLLRTKFQDSNEGGVSAGFGALDSVLMSLKK